MAAWRRSPSCLHGSVCTGSRAYTPAHMERRAFLKSLAAVSAVGLARPRAADADLPPAKITRVRIYEPPTLNPLFNQSNMVCTVETDIGITGIGEGGSKDTLEQCAGTLI